MVVEVVAVSIAIVVIDDDVITIALFSLSLPFSVSLLIGTVFMVDVIAVVVIVFVDSFKLMRLQTQKYGINKDLLLVTGFTSEFKVDIIMVLKSKSTSFYLSHTKSTPKFLPYYSTQPETSSLFLQAECFLKHSR